MVVPRLLVLAVCFYMAHASLWCRDFENIPASEARTVYVSVASDKCGTPLSNVSICQYCKGNTRLRTINSTEIAPGLYKYTSMSSRHVILLRKHGSCSKLRVIDSSSGNITTSTAILQCDSTKKRCFKQKVQLTLDVCPDFPPPTVLTPFACSAVGGGNVFNIKICTLPTRVYALSGNEISAVDIISTTQQIDLCGCRIATITLNGSCTGDPAQISGATFSIPFIEMTPGVYEMAVCEEGVTAIIQKLGHKTMTIVPEPGKTVVVTLACQVSLVMVKHPQSKIRNLGDSVSMCCKAISIPDGETITYQWSKDGTPLAGETGSQIALVALAAGDSGDYTCTAEIATESLSVVSNPATLIVTGDNLLALQPNNINICGNAIDTGTCLKQPCDVGTAGCYDDGIITADTTMEKFDPVCIIAYTQTLSCQCAAADPVTIKVTVQDAMTKLPLSGISVTCLGELVTATTDANGEATLTLPAGSTNAILNVVDGTDTYIDTIKVLDPLFGSSVETTVSMFKKADAITLDPSVENTLSVSGTPTDPGSSVRLIIPANSFFNAAGELVTGAVDIFMNVISPTASIVDTAPGVFKTRDANGDLMELQTGGVFTITAEDGNGNRVGSLPIQVEATNGFKLWVLKPDGTWEEVATARRRKRQTGGTTVLEFIGEIGIDIDGVIWYNIDKFPENTRCWFKAKVYDVGTGLPMPDVVGYFYKFLTVAVTSEPAIFPRDFITINPSSNCIELRCDNPATVEEPVGFIALEAILGVDSVERAAPFDLSEYTDPVQIRYTTLNYAVEPTMSIRIDLSASDNGPFFNDKAVCEASGQDATEQDNVLRFKLTSPIFDDPYDGSNDRCVARVKYSGSVFSGAEIGSFLALSIWDTDKKWVYAGEFIGNDGQLVLCMEYRCSTLESATTVHVALSFVDFTFVMCENAMINPPVIVSIGNGLFINTDGNAGSALNSCTTEMLDTFATESVCFNAEQQLRTTSAPANFLTRG